MNLSIVLIDILDKFGMLKTYGFLPINQYNKVVVCEYQIYMLILKEMLTRTLDCCEFIIQINANLYQQHVN